MYHLSAYTSSLVTGALTEIPALSDDILRIDNNRFVLPRDRDLVAFAAMSVDLQRVRIATPTTRQLANPWMRPFIDGAVPVDDPEVVDLSVRPIRLRGQEEVKVEALQDNAAAQRFTALLFISDSLAPVPAGEPFKIRATSTGAAVANAWTTIDYTLEQQLPSGLYSVIGAEVIGANGQAFRLIFDDQFDRPGFLCSGDVNQRNNDMLQEYALGEWGRFNTVTLPRLQVLANAATASWEIYYELIKTA